VILSSLEDSLFRPSLNQNWHMVPAERAALLYVLGQARPDVSIEIGTFLAGSLRPISAYSKRVITFDIDEMQHRIAPMFPNTTFVSGDTASTLPPIIEQLNAGTEELGFIPIDGSHETAGVTADVNNCLKYIPKTKTCFILMHDSSNPAVRAGIVGGAWEQCPYVHGLDLDFVGGSLYNRPDINGEIWGGLGVAVLKPTPRDFPLQVMQPFEHSLEQLRKHSVYT
jgi:hypothetical protein